MLQTTFKKEIAINNEILSNVVNGINLVFATSHNFKSGSLIVYLNGLQQKEGLSNDYIIAGLNTINMNIAPLSGDVLVADYIKL